MKKSILFLFLGITLTLVGCVSQSEKTTQYSDKNILNNIDKTYRCEADSDCVSPGISCLPVACWNKDNLPKPPKSELNEGMCAPPVRVSSCVCEKNRCQPSQNERTNDNFHFQSCDTDKNCFDDEICLASNTRSWYYEYPVKEINADNKVCYTKCSSDKNCPKNMICQSAKYVSKELWTELHNTKDWENNIELKQADIVKYCIFSK